MDSILNKYAKLLVNYCASLKEGEKIYIKSTTLAEPLVREVYREALRAGGIPYVYMEFRDEHNIKMQESNEQQIQYVDPMYAQAVEHFDAYLFIRAPFYSRSTQTVKKGLGKLYREAMKPYRTIYSQRTGTLDLKRTLCEYPTIAHAQNAGLSVEEYANFIYNACNLFEDNPQACWEEVSRNQQAAVDLLNSRTKMRYVGEGTDISFSTEGRIWINSDGKTNMPSGEVYTAPVDNSVNGTIHFSYPSMFMGEEVEGITLWVEEGEVVKWEAKKGKALLDRILSIDAGSRKFGEAAIGMNTKIQTPVKNILYDEKIGGTVHMALGQAYIQNNGTNKSAIHWDMIADMKNGGRIYADNEVIYEDGKFIF